MQLIIPRATKQTQRRFELQVYEMHSHAFSSTSGCGSCSHVETLEAAQSARQCPWLSCVPMPLAELRHCGSGARGAVFRAFTALIHSRAGSSFTHAPGGRARRRAADMRSSARCYLRSTMGGRAPSTSRLTSPPACVCAPAHDGASSRGTATRLLWSLNACSCARGGVKCEESRR